MGIMKGNHTEEGAGVVNKIPMYEGRGLEAPAMKSTIYHKGSQK